MKTILAENDEVKFKSYCPKHSSTKKGDDETFSESPGQENGNGIQDNSLPAHIDPFHSMDQNQEEAHRVSLRKQKLQQLEDEFYTFVEAVEVAKVLRLPEELVGFLYQYWKLKRKANFNKPLITPKKDEEDNLAKREQDVLFRRLQLFTHLRQDLERVSHFALPVLGHGALAFVRPVSKLRSLLTHMRAGLPCCILVPLICNDLNSFLWVFFLG